MVIEPLDVPDYDILRCEDRQTAFGPCFRWRVHRDDKAPMGFEELWKVFQQSCPGTWGVQSFPPGDRLLNCANKYHIMVFDEAPKGLDMLK
jgi:hypothetical protein